MKKERKYIEVGEPPQTSANYVSGCWHGARWRPDNSNLRTNKVREIVRSRERWVPNLLTADQAANFGAGLIGREELPPRMIPINLTKIMLMDGYGRRIRIV